MLQHLPCGLLPHRLCQLSSRLQAREAELDKLGDQLQAEVAAAAHKAAGQAAELSGERALLAKQSAALDQEREAFKTWVAERKEELARQHKVSRERSAQLGERGTENTTTLSNWWLRTVPLRSQ